MLEFEIYVLVFVVFFFGQ